jgi:hypothetical protein
MSLGDEVAYELWEWTISWKRLNVQPLSARFSGLDGWLQEKTVPSRSFLLKDQIGAAHMRLQKESNVTY